MACFCTGECRSNPCHPCNGGIAGIPRMRDGWRCPTCGRNYAPWVFQCPSCTASPPIIPMGDCGCPPYGTCMNTACPRRIQITCETTTTGGALRPWTQEEIERIILSAARDQIAEEGED